MGLYRIWSIHGFFLGRTCICCRAHRITQRLHAYGELHNMFLLGFSHRDSICVQSATITLTQITIQTKIK